MENLPEVNPEYFKLIEDYEKQAIVLFWQWARFPENRHKLPQLEANRGLVETMVRLLWNCFSSSDGQELFTSQFDAFKEIMSQHG